MKKFIFIFIIFTFICSFFVFKEINSVYADNNQPNNISVFALDKDDQPLDTSIFYNNVLSVDYASLDDDFKVTFVTNAISGAAQWKKNDVAMEYQNEYQLTLYKTTSNKLQLILVGETRYSFVLIEDGEEQSIDIIVRITDETDARKIIFNTTLNPQQISNNTPTIYFTALLPSTKSHTITYYVKTPNANEYRALQSSSNVYEFNPSKFINSKNGYGLYSFMAMSVETLSSIKTKIHYSQTFNYTASVDTIDVERITISSEIVQNTRARVEACKFTLNNANNIDYNLVHWYIGEKLYCVGSSFVYEPVSTDAYRVVAKYATSSDILTELDSLRIEPQTTGTNLLILYVGIGVAVISLFFAISIIITNKRRDIAW